MTKPTHGGKRPNAGRRPSGDQPRTIRKSIKLTAEEDEYLRGSEYGYATLWRLLQDSKAFQKWKAGRPPV